MLWHTCLVQEALHVQQRGVHDVVAQQPEVGVHQAANAVAWQVVLGIRPVAWKIGGSLAQHLIHGWADCNCPGSHLPHSHICSGLKLHNTLGTEWQHSR